jgi:hypothetical protein
MLKQSVVFHRLKQKINGDTAPNQQNDVNNQNSSPHKWNSSAFFHISRPLALTKQESDSLVFFGVFVILLFLTQKLYSPYKNLVFIFPLGGLILICIAGYGIWKNNDIFRSVGSISLIDTFILGAFSFLFGKPWAVIYLFGILVGSVCFLMKPVRDWRTTVFAAMFYLVILVATEFTSAFSLLIQINLFAARFTAFLILLFPFVMIIFIYMKEHDHFSKKQLSAIEYSEYDLKLIELFPHGSLHAWQLLLTVSLQLFFTIFVYPFTQKWTQLITVSTWSFTICIIIWFFRNYDLNSWIVSVMFPISWLLLLDYDLPRNWIDFLDIFFHLFIVAVGFHLLLGKKAIRWDYILTIGFSVLLYGFMVNTYIPGYLGSHALGLIYFVICTQLVLSMASYNWIKEIYDELPENTPEQVINPSTPENNNVNN